MKRFIALCLLMVTTFSLSACQSEVVPPPMEPKVAQMKAICELATMDCYYHTVAKYKEKDASGVLFWKKDKHFWVEYAGIVTVGIDVSLVNITIDGENVTITMPPGEVQGCRVDSNDLTEDSFIIDKDSAEITAEDQTKAFEAAQAEIEKLASEDKTLLENAQVRAQKLLEDYVYNVGTTIGKQYHIDWVYVDKDGKSIDS